MNTSKRLHLANGTVYLDGWINVDIDGHLAKDRPDLVEINKTDYGHYYKQEVSKEDFMAGTFHTKEKVCDIKADIGKLPFVYSSIDEILGVQILEHFSLQEAGKLLKYWHKLLKDYGTLELHVPDTEGIIKQYVEEQDLHWAVRQLYGSQKDQYSLHKYGYTWESLEWLLLDTGFTAVTKVASINSYPSISLKAVK